MKTTEQVLRDQIADLERLLELKNARIIELELQVTRSTQSFKVCTCQSTACQCKNGGCIPEGLLPR